MPIPRIIHQTWKDTTAHPALNYCMESFQFMNPDWEWRFYTDADCLRWVRERCPEMLGAFNAYQTGIHRADFFRILVLYYDGGVYADIDVECVRPLDELLSRLPPDRTVYLTRDHPIHERIHFGRRPMWMNDFMVAVPGDPLMGEILNWMLNSPPTSADSSNAVNETGPGVMSSVVEMLGGPEMVPGLGVIPTPWVHGLPDMNCGFPEKHFYGEMIAQRTWQQRDVFVVHYWFHTWVTGADTNMLTDYADVLMSTRGEQVERLLQWELRNATGGLDHVIACALTELAEMGGRLEIWLGQEPCPAVERFLELLALTSLQPQVTYRCWSRETGPNPIKWHLDGMGATQVANDDPLGRRRMMVFVAGFIVAPEVPNFNGLLLGPALPGGELIATGAGLTLSERWLPEDCVPTLLHLFPSDERFASAIATHFETAGWQTKLWTADQLKKRLQEETLGALATMGMSHAELETGGALLVLRDHGGMVFVGDSREAAASLQPLHRPTVVEEPTFWYFCCASGCDTVEGAFQHWQRACRRGRPNATTSGGDWRDGPEVVAAGASVREFLSVRLRAIHRTGRAGSLDARRARIGPFTQPVTLEVADA